MGFCARAFWELYERRSQFAEMVGHSQGYVTVLIAVERALVIIELATGPGHSEMLLTGSGLSLIFFSMGGYVLILIGGFLLRYVILTAGHIFH
jgi:hypothetical protein